MSPGEGNEKVLSLLKELSFDNIQVADKYLIEGIYPSWREFNRQIIWGKVFDNKAKFRNADDGYWKLIRHNALKYWAERDRNKIFDIPSIMRKVRLSTFVHLFVI